MITFIRDWHGYSTGSSISTLADTIEAQAVSEGAAVYGGASFPLNSNLDADNNVTGLVGSDGVPIPMVVVSYTLATLPAAVAKSGQVAFVSDIGAGIYVRSNGARWLPMNGEAQIYALPAAELTTTTAAETVLVAVPLPIGLWANGDRMRVNVRLLKSGEADTITLTMRVHTSPSAVGGAGTTWANVTQPATTNNDAQGIWWLKRLTATTLRSGMAGSSITGTLAALPVTVTTGSNMDAVQYYMQFNITISGGGGETATLADLQVVWIPAYS